MQDPGDIGWIRWALGGVAAFGLFLALWLRASQSKLYSRLERHEDLIETRLKEARDHDATERGKLWREVKDLRADQRALTERLLAEYATKADLRDAVEKIDGSISRMGADLIEAVVERRVARAARSRRNQD